MEDKDFANMEESCIVGKLKSNYSVFITFPVVKCHLSPEIAYNSQNTNKGKTLKTLIEDSYQIRGVYITPHSLSFYVFEYGM